MTTTNVIAKPVYNAIGKTYDLTRKADKNIINTLISLLAIQPNQHYLDVGCGSGNYTTALANHNISIDGIDVSSEMLEKAKQKSDKVHWFLGDAAHLPFHDATYAGAISTLATHHMHSLDRVFTEIFRVLAPQSHFVIFTATPEQMQNYWLCHYFPQMMRDSAARMQSLNTLQPLLLQAGFRTIETKPFFITNELEDYFLHAGKFRPDIYLDKQVRDGISSFQLHPAKEEIEYGLKKLENDIASGKINDIQKKYDTKDGDYLFVVAVK